VNGDRRAEKGERGKGERRPEGGNWRTETGKRRTEKGDRKELKKETERKDD